MSESSLHGDILSDNISDALQVPAIDNWAARVIKQYARLGLASPFSCAEEEEEEIQYVH